MRHHRQALVALERHARAGRLVPGDEHPGPARALQRRYPPGPSTYTDNASDVDIRDEAFIAAPRPARTTVGPLKLIYVGTLVQYPLDFWHHVATGQMIADSGSIPRHDTLTFTIAGRPTPLENGVAMTMESDRMVKATAQVARDCARRAG